MYWSIGATSLQNHEMFFFLPSSDSCKHSIDNEYIFFWKSTLLTLLKPLFLETTAPPPPSVLGISAPPQILLGLAAPPPGLHRSCNTSSSYALPSTPAPEAAPFSPCQIKERLGKIGSLFVLAKPNFKFT